MHQHGFEPTTSCLPGRRTNNCTMVTRIPKLVLAKWSNKVEIWQNLDTEAKRCFATHDEDNDYFNMRIYIILIACVYIQQFNFIQ